MYLHKGAFFLFLIMLGNASMASAQKAKRDSVPRMKNLSEIVVTATRSSRKLADVPIPVTLIGREQIQSTGASRLDEILSEQTGLAIINNHGFGVQMQGIDPEYCLILINGEPVIGRTAGTLNLTRITLNNVKRIEIIKGPSSSLYGSDALGGVINIITDDPQRTGLNLQTQYGKFNTSDHTLTGSLRLNQKGMITLSVNRYHTDGYDLMPQTYGKTVDPYTDYTLRGHLRYQFTPKLKMTLNGHYFSEIQKNNYLADENKDTIVVKGDGKEKDGSLNPVFTYRFSPSWKLKLHNYWSQYKTQSDLLDSKADTAYEDSYFTQNLWKEELQSENILGPTQILTTGLGFTRESVRATRYTHKEILSDYFLYLQYEWHPTARWNVLSGLRYDLPTAYHSQLSPKLAVQYKWNKHWKLQASIGTGYKSPDLRQLYLTFSNPVVGYSVLGTMAAKDGLAKMEEEGQIERVYINPDKLDGKLKPESSIAYNLGGSYTANTGWKVSMNLFRNDIKDMIDTRVIALKANGQPLYSYYNVHSVFTEGLETDVRFPLFVNKFVISAGYQFLIAKDKTVVEDIRQGEIYIRNPETMDTRKLKMSEYGGLFNRSRHSFNVKLYYTYHSWSANARLAYHSRFGFADMNDNGILDSDNEYAPGYALCHLNISKTFWSDQIKVRAGVKDLFNYTDPQHLSYVSGREWYVGATLSLFKTNKN